jgi:hypothetical protein
LKKNILYVIFFIFLFFEGCSIKKVDRSEILESEKIEKSLFSPSLNDLEKVKYIVEIEKTDIQSIKNINLFDSNQTHKIDENLSFKLQSIFENRLKNYLSKLNNLTLLSDFDENKHQSLDFKIQSKINNFFVLEDKIIFSANIKLYNSKFNFLEQSYILNFSIFEHENINLKKIELALEEELLKTTFFDDFQYKRGFISEKKRNKEGFVYFKVNLGKRNQVAKGDRVSIFAIEERTSFLTQQKTRVKVKIATATITNKIEQKHSWIKLIDMKKQDKIKSGHMVILESDNFKDMLDDGKNFIKNHPEMLENNIRLK